MILHRICEILTCFVFIFLYFIFYFLYFRISLSFIAPHRTVMLFMAIYCVVEAGLKKRFFSINPTDWLALCHVVSSIFDETDEM